MGDCWSELIGLVDPEWRRLAEGLRKAGLPPAFDVDWEIPSQGRVSEARAVMVWKAEGRHIGIVAEGVPMPDSGDWLAASPNAEPAVLAEALRRLLDKGSAR